MIYSQDSDNNNQSLMLLFGLDEEWWKRGLRLSTKTSNESGIKLKYSI